MCTQIYIYIYIYMIIGELFLIKKFTSSYLMIFAREVIREN
jgi:hypothetical protein